MSSFLLRVYPALRARLFPLLDGFVLFFFPFNICGAKVLVVKLDAIGDFVIWLDAAREMGKHFHSQGYTLVLLASKAWASWAREMDLVDEVWDMDVARFRENLLYRWKWLIRIRKAGFKIAIQPTYSRRFLEGDSLVRASGAVERIGSVGESNITPWYKSWSNSWYTRLIPATPMQLMELKRNAEFMRGLGFTDFKARLPTIPQASDEKSNWFPQQLYAVFVPTAGWDGREWPIDNFIKLGRRLVAVDLRIVVVGELADHERVSGLIDGLSGEAIDLVGKTTLGELAEVLRGATIVVTNETSAVHIGAAMDVPVVCILGGGHFGRFAPYEIEVTEENRNLPFIVTEPMSCYGCQWQCQYPRQNGEAVKCIQDISVEKVWNAVEMVLKKRGKKIAEWKNE